jgi:hypothetical protein
MASDLKTLIKAADIMRKASMSDRSMAPVWKPSKTYIGVEDSKREAQQHLKQSLIKVVKADLTSAQKSTVVQILEAHNVANKKMSVKMELLNGSSNAVKDQIIADANARISIRDAFNALVDGASDGEYKGALSDDLSKSSTEYNASYDTEYLFPVYTSVENTKQQGGSSAPKFTRQMYRDALKTVRAQRAAK